MSKVHVNAAISLIARRGLYKNIRVGSGRVANRVAYGLGNMPLSMAFRGFTINSSNAGCYFLSSISPLES